VALFTIPFQRPFEFGVAVGIAAIMVLIILRSAMVAETGKRPWVRAITGPNAKVLFAGLFVAWAVVFGIGLLAVPHEGANSPYGGLGLIALFTGFFIMMGFIWAVIGE
jgi:hypothetical protein